MLKFLQQPAYKPAQTGPEADAKYKRMRLQVFIGAFIGYAGFYLVRKNLSMAIQPLEVLGFVKSELGFVLGLNAAAYALSKFLMGSVSDRSNARVFLPLGLILTAIAMCFMIVPIQFLGAEHKKLAILVMGVLNFLVGWFNGMGWPPCGRVMTHWFSVSERGTMMSIWNCAHNVGGALVGPMATYGALWFGKWFYGSNESLYFLIGTFAFPAAVALFIALLAYVLLRDTPQSCGLQSIEAWRNDYPKNYSEKQEQTLTTKEIFFKYVLNNKFLWYIALANAFVYMVRYGCLDWAPAILGEKGIELKDAGWAYFAFEIAAIPGTLLCGWLSDKLFHGKRALPTMIFMGLVTIFVFLEWHFISRPDIANLEPVEKKTELAVAEAGADTTTITLAEATAIAGDVVDEAEAGTEVETVVESEGEDTPKPAVNLTGIIIALIGIGFFIYGPVMLIGVQALDLAPKNAAGTAAGLTGFFGYFLGTFILANTLIGWVSHTTNGWNVPFIMLIGACVLAILFMGLTYKEERKQSKQK